MFDFVQVLSTVLPIIATILLLFVILLNLYCNLRRKFPISVNCWFCNGWTKVDYDDRNSFDCPHCSQYNGFARDGGYNKIIPEQHDEFMNNGKRVKSRSPATNGLCTLCNNNQQLKIFQLANFVPMVEENYNKEIEHFQTQVEKAYKLCKKCNRVLKNTLEKQSAWVFGKRLKNLCQTRLTSLHSFYSNVKTTTNQSWGLTFVTLLSFVSTIFVFVIRTVKFITANLIEYVPTGYVDGLRQFHTIIATAREFNLSPYAQKTVKIEAVIMFCIFGVVLQGISSVFEKSSLTLKCNRMLCWIILLLSNWTKPNRNLDVYLFIAQVFCVIYLTYSCFGETRMKSRKHGTKQMRKSVKNLETTCTDFSDVSDSEDVSRSSKNVSTSSRNSTYSPRLRGHIEKRVPIHSTANTTLGNCSFSTATDNDLHASLNSLNLGKMNFKSPPTFSVTSPSRPKPVLSPPRFQAANQNSWVAGGFWRNSNGVILPVPNLSRSSSETSGFESQKSEFDWAPPSNVVLTPVYLSESGGLFTTPTQFPSPLFLGHPETLRRRRDWAGSQQSFSPSTQF